MGRCTTALRTDLQVRELGVGIARRGKGRRRERLATPMSKLRKQSLTNTPSRSLPNPNSLLHHSLLFRRLHLTYLNLPQPPQRPRQHATALGRLERPPPCRQAARERWRRHVG
jgi:hypothetical protein